MKIVVQRVRSARVMVAAKTVGQIQQGILILLGVHKDDTPLQADFLAEKCARLRIFTDPEGKMNFSLLDIRGSALVVSQFTLLGDCAKGRRPSFTEAAEPLKGRQLYEYFVAQLRKQVPDVQCGIFGAMMEVELINDGPVTLILEK